MCDEWSLRCLLTETSVCCLLCVGLCCAQDPILDGVRHAIMLSNQHSVYSLAIPAVFSEAHLTSGSLTNKPITAEVVNQIESVFRCVRSCLTELAEDPDSHLQEVCFLVPPGPKSPLLLQSAKSGSGQQRRGSQHTPVTDDPMVKECTGVFANVF